MENSQARYKQAITTLAQLHIRGMEEHAKEMNGDPSYREAGDPPITPESFLDTLEEQLRDGGILEDLQREVRKLLRTKVRLSCEMYEETYQALLNTIEASEKRAQVSGEEEIAQLLGEAWTALSRGVQR